jgi:hypothetical protein
MLARIYADELFQNTSPITLPKAPLKHYPAMAMTGIVAKDTLIVEASASVCARNAALPASACESSCSPRTTFRSRVIHFFQ